MLENAAASVVLIAGFVASVLTASAAPHNSDCVNCAALAETYESEAPARGGQENGGSWISEAGAAVPATQQAPAAAQPADARGEECLHCPPPRQYNSTEVIRNSRDVDQSRVINTETVVHVPPNVEEINKLVVRENETRNVGVIQHNHRIIEKEIRYVRRAPVYRDQHVRRAVQQVHTVLLPVSPSPASCGCPCTCSGGHNAYASAYVYQPGLVYDRQRGSMQKVWVPVPAAHNVLVR